MSTGTMSLNCKSFETIIFDIDGTLCDSFQLGFSATNTVLQKNGIRAISADEYHAGTKWTTPERLARHCGLDPQVDEQAFKTVGAKLGSEFDELYIGLVSTETAPFFPGAGELLRELAASSRLAALTNAAVAYAERVLETNGARGLFAVVHGADDVPRPKPAPDGLLQCCRELSIDPAAAVYVGDSPSDGAAARAAGMASVGVTWGSHGAATVTPAFDACVSTVAELRALLLAPV
jgi:HAD superfamily hydrolase (TIGR01509 family)